MVELGQKLLYSGKSGCIWKKKCIRAKVVVFGQSGFIGAKVVVFGQSGCIREKVVVLGKSG